MYEQSQVRPLLELKAKGLMPARSCVGVLAHYHGFGASDIHNALRDIVEEDVLWVKVLLCMSTPYQ